MSITIKEINIPTIECDYENIIILPTNFTEQENHTYQSSSLSFYKYAKQSLEVDFLNTPELLFEQNSADWFGPVILITSSALTQNPELISITCGVISNYLSDCFKGKEQPEVSLKIVHKVTKTTKTTEISYTGSGENLSELRDAILEVAKK
ncbi:MAG: hypothetical protein ACJAZP_003805 [Psychromonas sp.]|jgi:hypothetical protein|uniref:hypothetical protein n=1 Tax=Psychromonas sp. TaxID=1884585 RepID=UPI0039E58D86